MPAARFSWAPALARLNQVDDETPGDDGGTSEVTSPHVDVDVWPCIAEDDVDDEVVRSLSRKKPEERVTMQKGGAGILQDPPFVLAAFNVAALAHKKLEREINLENADIEPWDGSLPEAKEDKK
mmetsp:Transcript_146820/g.471377  ORF Transcript_146820/g.471377 Transcript_146820/m.471377 type:complete len:124 (-) Transcript_146820:110-481(-)